MYRVSAYTVYIFFTILACTSLVLTRYSRTTAYVTPASDDDLFIMSYNISYLFDLLVRLDRMLEIIYFGFLLALFFLSDAYRGLQSRIERLEEKIGDISKVARMDHPAYGPGPENGQSRESVMDRLQESETKRNIDAKRIEELEKKLVELTGQRAISA
jgi:hypothetical protein